MLDDVKQEWADVVEEEVCSLIWNYGYLLSDIVSQFNPVPLALALLDDSSAGRDLESFRYTKRQLETTLKSSVDSEFYAAFLFRLFHPDAISKEHYQAFAQSLPHHAALLSSLTKAQAELSEAKANLTESREALGNKRVDLVQLWSRGQTLDEMMRLLDEMQVAVFVFQDVN